MGGKKKIIGGLDKKRILVGQIEMEVGLEYSTSGKRKNKKRNGGLLTGGGFRKIKCGKESESSYLRKRRRVDGKKHPSFCRQCRVTQTLGERGARKHLVIVGAGNGKRRIPICRLDNSYRGAERRSIERGGAERLKGYVRNTYCTKTHGI